MSTRTQATTTGPRRIDTALSLHAQNREVPLRNHHEAQGNPNKSFSTSSIVPRQHAAAPQCDACMDWYLSGLLQGRRDAELDQEQQTELAVRRYLALTLAEVDAVRESKRNQDWFDVAAARARRAA